MPGMRRRPPAKAAFGPLLRLRRREAGHAGSGGHRLLRLVAGACGVRRAGELLRPGPQVGLRSERPRGNRRLPDAAPIPGRCAFPGSPPPRTISLTRPEASFRIVFNTIHRRQNQAHEKNAAKARSGRRDGIRPGDIRLRVILQPEFFAPQTPRTKCLPWRFCFKAPGGRKSGAFFGSQRRI